MHGAAFDVVVDLRVGSPTFGQWDAVLLDDDDRRAVYLPEGLGHAFMALEDHTVVNYLCSAPYAPGREHGIHPLDPEHRHRVADTARDGRPITPLLSPKDEAAPTLAEVRDQGLLATYEDAQAFSRSLRRLSPTAGRGPSAAPTRPGGCGTTRRCRPGPRAKGTCGA